MSTLIEQSEELSEQCVRLATVNQDTELTRQIDAVEAKVETLSETSGLVLQTLSTMLDGGLCEEIQWNLTAKLGELSERLGKVLEKAREEPGKLKNDQTWAKCDRLAKDLENDLRVILSAQWRDFVDRKTQNRIATFSAYRGLSQCKSAVEDLGRKEGQAENRREQLPASADEIAFILEISESMSELIEGLGIEGEPAEMIEFLKRCASSDGVPLSELTDERLAWLRGGSFGESLRIRG